MFTYSPSHLSIGLLSLTETAEKIELACGSEQVDSRFINRYALLAFDICLLFENVVVCVCASNHPRKHLFHTFPSLRLRHYYQEECEVLVASVA